MAGRSSIIWSIPITMPKFNPNVRFSNPEAVTEDGVQLFNGAGSSPTYGLKPALGNKCYYRATGEFRAPKKGEFFLSGAIPFAYRTENDLNTEYWIMAEVEAEIKTKTVAILK